MCARVVAPAPWRCGSIAEGYALRVVCRQAGRCRDFWTPRLSLARQWPLELPQAGFKHSDSSISGRSKDSTLGISVSRGLPRFVLDTELVAYPAASEGI